MDLSFKGSDNKQYHLAELNLGHMATDVPIWVQFRPFEKFKLMKDKLSPEQYEQESSRLLMECSKKQYSLESPEVQNALNTLECSIFLVYLSLKNNHPNITYEEVSELVTARNQDEIKIKLMVVNGTLSEDSAKKS